MPAPIDRLSPLLRHFHVRTRMFHSGPLCGTTPFYDGPDVGHLHVLEAGRLKVEHYGDARALPRLQLDTPTLLFYPRGAAHRFVTPQDGSTRMVCAAARFEGGAAHPVAAALPPLCVVPLQEAPALMPTLAALFAEAAPQHAPVPACGRQLVCDRLFEALLVQLVRWLVDHRATPAEGGLQGLLAGLAHPQLARALTALHDRPGEPWDLPRLAAAAGMSRSAFAAAFRQAVGVPPGDYLAGWRMALARQRIAAGEPLKTVAEALGYSGAAALSRAFAARLGQTPRQWQRDSSAAA